jgi:hypothetical protein
MKRLLLILPLLLTICLSAQNPQPVQHAPDGGTMERLMSIYISSMPNAPFSATLATEWTKVLEDGTTMTLQNHRPIMRDSAGRIYQERRLFLPTDSQRDPPVTRIEITDPVAHKRYFCNPANRTCGAFPFNPPPPGAFAQHVAKANFQTLDLGKSEIAGVEAVGTRETMTINPGAVGNDRSLAVTKDIWYSKQLDLNVSVKRVDPRHGTETFTVKELSLSEPPPEWFKVPSGYQVVNRKPGTENAE